MRTSEIRTGPSGIFSAPCGSKEVLGELRSAVSRLLLGTHTTACLLTHTAALVRNATVGASARTMGMVGLWG